MANSNALPPGSSGLPLLGETLAFTKDIFGFIRTRAAKYGPVFRSNILGTDTAFISGPEVSEQWLDESKIQRAGAFPGPILQLFGGPGILPLLDGDEHRKRKQLVMAGFSREALAGYLPGLSQTIESFLSRFAAGGERPVTPELKLLAIEGICGNVLGLAPGPQLAQLVTDYGLVMRGFTGLPIPLPGTTFHAALRARDRILAALAAQVREHQARAAAPAAPAAPVAPGSADAAATPPDGLARILAARTPDGTSITAAQATLELHHVVLAGVIVFAELAALLLELFRHEGVRARLLAEVQALPPGPVTPATLRQLPYLDQVVMEVKRTCPNVPVSFGRARAPVTVGGVTIPAGWNVMMAVGEHNLNRVFKEPLKFDPDRFSEARAEHRIPHAFGPQGLGSIEQGHKCAGYDYSTVFMQLFTLQLLRGYTWEVPAQDLELNFGLVPPEYKSGLRVRIKTRGGPPRASG